MATSILIQPDTRSESLIEKHVFNYLSESRGNGLMVNLREANEFGIWSEAQSPKKIDRSSDLDAKPRAVGLINDLYPDVELSRATKIVAYDSDFNRSAEFVLFLANNNQSHIKFIFNSIPLIVNPTDTLEDLQEAYLDNFMLSHVNKSNERFLTVEQEGTSLANHVQNCCAIASLKNEPVFLSWVNPHLQWEVSHAIISPNTDHLDVRCTTSIVSSNHAIA